MNFDVTIPVKDTAIIRSVTGRVIDLLHFQHRDVEATAIACGLAKVCRFAGQIEEFYSVAQHSLMVASLAGPRHAKLATLHDASEAYIGDISRFLKQSPVFDRYRELEHSIQTTIEEAFQLTNVSEESRRVVKAADDLAACYERALVRDRRAWSGPADIYDAIATGFISGDRASLVLPMVDRLPSTWGGGWSPEVARIAFEHSLRIVTD